MNTFKLMTLVAAGLLLGGCAELKELTGTADAPIEERGAVPTAGAGAAASGLAGRGADTAGTGAAQGVETHALPGPGGSDTGAVGAEMGRVDGGVPAILGVSPEKAAMLRDPNNPLSKRVIYFDFDSDAIREEFRGLIEAHAGFLKENGGARIILQGHTDERGSRDYNLALGQRRAESVRQALNLMTVSLGEEKPIQEGHDETAWQQNRRAEIHYVGE
jgi:peptidoglycan-associated lipoprotein